ncbi:MAG: hypothetical protein KDC12_15295 [Flavobacteriales bacterium]|nr:hypothetical protein [Flavobacteriales bacterium]
MAQKVDSVWVVGGHRPLPLPNKLIRTEFLLDGRYTNAYGDDVRLLGFRTGIEIKRVHRMGFGLYTLTSPIVKYSYGDVEGEVDVAHFTFSYISTYYERVLFFNKRWEWVATGHAGRGSIRASYSVAGKEEFVEAPPVPVSPLELSTSLYFHPTWWLSVGAGGGYRYMTRTPREVRSTYNSPVVLFRVKLRFVKIVRRMFNENVKYEY